MVVQVRGLDTGGSRDVGGVVRICRGGIGPEEETEDDEEKEVEEVRGRRRQRPHRIKEREAMERKGGRKESGCGKSSAMGDSGYGREVHDYTD